MSDIPDKLRPYFFHGIGLHRPKHGEASAECPFCGREGKFSVNLQTGQWKCWVCAKGTSRGGGNVYTFIREFQALCFDATSSEDYQRLVEDRGFLDSQGLIEWQICKNINTNDWMIPGYNPQGQMVSLYRYIRQPDGGYRMLPTPTLGHHIHGMNLWDSNKPIIYICEGPWDAIALYEVLSKCKNTDEGLRMTASPDYSLYAQANIIAMPGAEVFFEAWLPLFQNKVVNLMYDSDHPRKHSKTGHITSGAGWKGCERITRMFCESKYQPQELNCIHWGEDGYDPKRKSGFDIRDYLIGA